MKVKRARLNNMFQYRDFEVEFTSGINLIVGPNGVGKSNLLNSIKFALTGETPFKKQLCANVMAGEDAVCCVEIEGEHHGDFLIHRDLHRPAQAKFKHASGTVKGANQVTKAITELLGISIAHLTDHVFIPQGKLRAFIDSTPNERLELISQLLDLNEIEARWQALGDYINSARAIELIDYATELNTLARAEKELEDMAKVDASLVHVQDNLHRKLVDARTRLQTAQQMLQRQEAKLQHCQATLEKEKARVGFTENPKLEPWLPHLVGVRQYYDVLKRLHDQLKRRAPMQPKVEQVHLDYVADKKSKAESMVKFYGSAVQVASASGECLLCGSTIDPDTLQARIDEARTRLMEEISELHDTYITLKDIQRKRREAVEDRERIRQLIAQLRTFRTTLPANPPELAMLEAYAKQKAEWEQVQKGLAELLSEIEKAQQNITSSKAVIESLEKEIRATEEHIIFSKADVDRQLTALKRREELLTQISLLKSFREKQTKLDAAKERLHTLVQVREIFHRRNLITRIITGYVNTLSSRINKLLAEISMPYTVSITPEMACVVTYSDGRIISEGMLSYGEQLALSLCYHLAVNQVHNLHFVVLDEPTLGLDEHRISQVPELLTRFAEVQGDRFQILCCTHERDLLKCAHNVIELRGAT